ncbi:MAG TPA: DUF748 domain-containing protein [Opitutaceae bacterium]|nr:DUF748 domain-containing protein [Opitutaceae bacterium]HND61453.1 DUF748 domain-containing protein [Opitutaceae bacterium]
MNFTPRVRRRFVVALSAILLFTVVGFFVLPPIIRSQAEKRLTVLLGRQVTIGKVRLNPYALSLTVENFDIRLKTGDGSFMGWNRLYVNFDALSSLWGEWVVSDVELDGFHVGVVILQDGSLNFADLIERVTAKPANAPPPAPSGPSRPVRVGSLKVTDARLEFSDRSRPLPFATTLGPVSVAVTNFRTVGEAGAPYHFLAVTEAGEKLEWSGTLSAQPLKSDGELRLENILLPKYAPYYSTLTKADLVGGTLSVHGRYAAAFDNGKAKVQLSDGAVQLRGVKVVERATKETALELATLDLNGLKADPLAPKVALESLVLSGGTINLRREADGSLSLLNMLQPEATPSAVPAKAVPATPAAGPAKRPDVTLGEFALKDFKVNVTDRAAPRPAQLALGGIQFSLKKLTLADGAVMPFDLSLAWAPQGAVRVSGTAAAFPSVVVDLKADVVGLELLPLSPYLEQFVNARLTQGAVSTSQTVHLALPTGGAPDATVAGEVTVEKLGLVDSAHNEDLVGFARLGLTGIKVATAPKLTVSLDEISVAGPYARVLVNADKTVNLQTVAKAKPAPVAPPQPESSPATPTAAPAPAELPSISIGRVVISDGDFSFTDRSLEPNVRMALGQFGGTITGLSSENLARAAVDLKGAVDGVGPVAIVGQLDPLGAKPFVDLKVDFKNVDLLPISPYTGKFAGYELARGKLVVDTKVHVDGRQLDTTNVVTLNQFTFGAATNSKDATGLPVRLGVALLKDLDGNIVIDLPVQGSLDDPNFRIGKVVLRVIVNLLTKAATSPFSLLGSMFGGGGDELAFQEFTPGGSELQPTELPKLATMVKALTNRPGLSLGLEGSFDTAADTYALKRQKLSDLVRRQIWEAKHAVDPNIAPPAQLVITAEEEAAMVKKLFDEKFPPGTQFGAPLAGPPPVAAAPAPKPGLVRHVINVITFKSAHSEAAKPKPAEAAATVAAPGIPLEEMTGRLAETMTVGDNDLRALATARAEQVRNYLLNTGHIAGERLFLAQATDAAKQAKGPRVFLSLQ